MYSPKRKVRSNGKTVVGQVSSFKKKGVQFESGLEEDFIYLLNFDSDVKTYHDQPVQIEFISAEGKKRLYTPDFLVEYHNRPPVLFEVKSNHYIQLNKIEYQENVDAAIKYCAARGWDFVVITDKEIRTSYFENVKTLFRYQTYQVDISVTNEIINTLRLLGRPTLTELLRKITPDHTQWSLHLAAVWTLIRHKRIGVNLFESLHMEVPIWLTEPSNFIELKYPYKP